MIKVGIIDYLQDYMWKKKIERAFKQTNNKLLRNIHVDNTIIYAPGYAERFIKTMKTYLIQNMWSSAFENINNKN